MAMQLTFRPQLSAASLRSTRARVAAPLVAAPPCSRLHRQQQAASRRHSSSISAVLDLQGADQWKAEVLQADVPVLVDFWANWCGPCKLVAPTMVWAEKEYAGALKVVKVEADPNKDLIEEYKVYGLPTFLVFRNGEEVLRIEGAIPKAVLVDNLKKLGIEVPAAAQK